MKVVTLRQKESGRGSIHDIESQHYERKIYFNKGTKYAVVEASYYGGKGYKTFKSEEACIKFSKKTDYSHKIIDCEGNCYYVGYNGGEICLVKEGPLYCDD